MKLSPPLCDWAPPRRFDHTIHTIRTIVDSIPCSVAPPSTINGIRPSNSSNTCCAVVGLTPRIDSLGAASSRFTALTTSRKTGCALIRTATVSSPAVTMSGTMSRFRKIIVKGPGQKFSIKSRARAATQRSQSHRVPPASANVQLTDRTAAVPWLRKIFATASGLSASAASP